MRNPPIIHDRSSTPEIQKPSLFQKSRTWLFQGNPIARGITGAAQTVRNKISSILTKTPIQSSTSPQHTSFFHTSLEIKGHDNSSPSLSNEQQFEQIKKLLEQQINEPNQGNDSKKIITWLEKKLSTLDKKMYFDIEAQTKMFINNHDGSWTPALFLTKPSEEKSVNQHLIEIKNKLADNDIYVSEKLHPAHK